MKLHCIVIICACIMHTHGQEALYNNTHHHTPKKTHLFALPNELLQHIAEYTVTASESSPQDYTTLCTLTQTSKRYRNIIYSHSFIQRLFALASQQHSTPIMPLAILKDNQVTKTLFSKIITVYSHRENNRIHEQCWLRVFHNAPHASIVNIAWLIFRYKTTSYKQYYRPLMSQTGYNLLIEYTNKHTWTDHEQKTAIYHTINSIGKSLHKIINYYQIATYFEHVASLQIYSIITAYEEYITNLHDAAMTGDREYIAYIITHGIHPDATKDTYYNTALIQATSHGYKHIISDLLAAGADPNLCNYRGDTPLHYACKKNSRSSIIDTLLAYGANPSARNNQNTTPLWIVAQNNHIKAAKLLITHGANINTQKYNKGTTPLFIAIDQGNINLALYLIDREHTNVNVATYRNRTPLMRAAEHGQQPTVNALLHKGADTTVIHETGATALSFAQKNGHSDIADLLINR